MMTDDAEESEAVKSKNNSTEVTEELNLELSDELYDQISDMPDVLGYIRKLEKLVAHQRKKIQKLQRKLTKKVTTSTETQTGDDVPKKGIAEEITEAAESAMARTGFVYEETSGLYYDYNSGYYYNAEYGLYYDGNSGTYLSYDSEKQEYVFHSQVERPQEHNFNENDKRVKNTGKSQDRKRKKTEPKTGKNADTDLEEGECSDDSKPDTDTSDEEIDMQSGI